MAIRIFETVGRANTGGARIRRVPFLFAQSGVVSGSSTQSAALQADEVTVIQADEACHVAFGSNPTATTSDFKIEVGTTYDFGTTRGHKVAWIAAA
jgi:hypothetical protein